MSEESRTNSGKPLYQRGGNLRSEEELTRCGVGLSEYMEIGRQRLSIHYLVTDLTAHFALYSADSNERSIHLDDSLVTQFPWIASITIAAAMIGSFGTVLALSIVIS